jgi:short-subunit dehydrogenase
LAQASSGDETFRDSGFGIPDFFQNNAQPMATNKTSFLGKIGLVTAGAGLCIIANSIFPEVNKFELRNKVVIVTGGSRGLGLVLARQLALKGAKLAICARTIHQLEEARAELQSLGGEVISLPVDLTDHDEVRKMVSDVREHFGRIDVLINNAGIIQVGPFDSMEIEDFEQAMNTNFWAPLYAMLSVIPHFKKQHGGRIVNISSIGGKISVPHLIPYSASKFALTGLSEGMHVELKKFNIHVTTVIPHLMRTGSPMNITVKGNHEAEYALFKFSDSSSLMTQKAEEAAKRIVKAIEYGESETILTLTAKIAVGIMGIAPSVIESLLSITSRLLPDNVPAGQKAKKGYESESKFSRNRVTKTTDRQAIRNNEL